MSKVNVDEIKVGDLVEHTFEDDRCLGYVIEIYDGGLRALWSDPLTECNEDFEDENITGHWKVINFEEEDKVDELKVYTGKETIEALLEGKVLRSKTTGYEYKLVDNSLMNKIDKWSVSGRALQLFLTEEYTEVVTPQVGDWVSIVMIGQKVIGQLTSVDGRKLKALWSNHPSCETYLISNDSVEILSPEEVSEYKREQAFAKVGRKLNEFRSGDIVCINIDGGISIVVSNNNEESVRVHMLNAPGKGYTAKPHQLTPISFVEQQVDLS